MTLPVPEKSQAISHVDDSARRWINLLRSAQDGSRPAIGHWSVGDVAMHTSHVFQILGDVARGGTSPVEDHLRLSDHWEKLLAEDPERDPRLIADRLDQSSKEFLDALQQSDWEQPASWHGGVKVPTYALAGLVTGECVFHGLDVARALGRSWTIDPAKARLVIDGLLPVMPHFVKQDAAAGVHATIDFRFRGGPRVYMLIDDGSLVIDERTDRPIDCHVSADPVDYLLIGYGRKSQLGPALTGKILAWGKKPWLALKFAKLFHSI